MHGHEAVGVAVVVAWERVMTDVRPVLQGRRALVTGGSRGLGREVALALSRAGADVAVLARASPELGDVLAELEASTVTGAQKVAAIAVDLAVPSAADRALAAASRALGGVDVLVNNAGIIGAMGVLDQTTADEWAHTIQVNLLAPVSLMRAVLPDMRARRYGKIINLSGG